MHMFIAFWYIIADAISLRIFNVIVLSLIERPQLMHSYYAYATYMCACLYHIYSYILSSTSEETQSCSLECGKTLYISGLQTNAGGPNLAREDLSVYATK